MATYAVAERGVSYAGKIEFPVSPTAVLTLLNRGRGGAVSARLKSLLERATDVDGIEFIVVGRADDPGASELRMKRKVGNVELLLHVSAANGLQVSYGVNSPEAATGTKVAVARRIDVTGAEAAAMAQAMVLGRGADQVTSLMLQLIESGDTTRTGDRLEFKVKQNIDRQADAVVDAVSNALPAMFGAVGAVFGGPPGAAAGTNLGARARSGAQFVSAVSKTTVEAAINFELYNVPGADLGVADGAVVVDTRGGYGAALAFDDLFLRAIQPVLTAGLQTDAVPPEQRLVRERLIDGDAGRLVGLMTDRDRNFGVTRVAQAGALNQLRTGAETGDPSIWDLSATSFDVGAQRFLNHGLAALDLANAFNRLAHHYGHTARYVDEVNQRWDFLDLVPNGTRTLATYIDNTRDAVGFLAGLRERLPADEFEAVVQVLADAGARELGLNFGDPRLGELVGAPGTAREREQRGFFLNGAAVNGTVNIVILDEVSSSQPSGTPVAQRRSDPLDLLLARVGDEGLSERVRAAIGGLDTEARQHALQALRPALHDRSVSMGEGERVLTPGMSVEV